MKGIGLTALLSASVVACGGPPERVVGTPAGHLAALEAHAQDSTPKADLRLVPPEAYIRTFLQLFGGLAPLDAATRARGSDSYALFDFWERYISALGFPNHLYDIPRLTQTNTLMLATFERLEIALCDRAVEHDLASTPPAPVDKRVIFAFEAPNPPVDAAAFAEPFDVLHRTFLGYPARHAPKERAERFLQLYREIVATHKTESPKSRFTPDQAGWAAVCYGLVRHPEFHLY